MAKPLIAILLLIQLITSGCAPVPAGFDPSRPAKVVANADLDYAFINNIDSVTPPYPPGGCYQIGDLPTVQGKYTVYKYVYAYPGYTSLSEKPQTLHDLLVLKVDGRKMIVDAYNYTLEWSDTPSLDLQRLGKKGVRLRPGLRLAELGLAPVSPRANTAAGPEPRPARPGPGTPEQSRPRLKQ